MAVQALVVPTLDNYFNWDTHCVWQLVAFTYSVDYPADRGLDWILVAVFFGIGATNVRANSH